MANNQPPPPSQPSGLVAHVADYLEARRVQNATAIALRTATSRLGRFVEWCRTRGLERAAELTVGAVKDYQRWLYEYRQPAGEPLSFETQAGYLSSFRSFCRWLHARNLILLDLAAEIERPRLGQKLPSFLTAPEAARVLAAIDTSYGLGIRNRAMLEVLYSTGVRRLELVGLDVADVELEAGSLWVRLGKGKKDRVVPLGARAVAWVAKYLEEVRPRLARGETTINALFVASSGRRLSPGQLRNVIRDALAHAGIEKRGACHLLRHGMATAMLDGGADLRQIQKILGHENLSSTQRYTAVSIQKLQEVHARTHPARLERPQGAGDEDPDE